MLIATVQRLEERQAAAARLINLAILHGASPEAIDRLTDVRLSLGKLARSEQPAIFPEIGGAGHGPVWIGTILSFWRTRRRWRRT